MLCDDRNSAYWVDGAAYYPMCHKVGCDRTKNYLPVLESFDPKNPVVVEDGVVAALIWMDATASDGQIVQKRRERLLKPLRLNRDSLYVLCIPARFRTTMPKSDLSLLPDCWCVVATDKAHVGSFVANPQHKIVVEATTSENEIKLCALM